MKSILHAFASGSLRMGLLEGYHSPAYDQAGLTLSEKQNKLKLSLDESQRAQLEELDCAYGAVMAYESQGMLVEAYSLGMLMMMEIFQQGERLLGQEEQ